MVQVGDRIRLSSGKGANREGLVVAVTGVMVRVRWSSDEETAVVPAPGTLTVLPPVRATKRAKAAKPAPAPAPAPAKKTPAARKPAAAKKSGAAKKATAKKAAVSKAVRRPPG